MDMAGRARGGLRFLLALLPVPITLAVQLVSWPFLRPYGLFLFIAAIYCSAGIGGFSAGLVSTAAALVLVGYFFVPPERSWAMAEPRHLVVFVLFAALGVVMSFFQERFRRTHRALSTALADGYSANARLQRANEEVGRLYEKTRDLDALKTSLFAGVSHELRTPLSLVLGPVERLLDDPALDGAVRDHLAMVARNARVMLRCVDDLLSVARLTAGQVELEYTRVDVARLTRVVASCFEEAARAKGIAYAVEAPGASPAEVDAVKVQRILLNLLSNALKFTPAGGRVRVSLRIDEDRDRVEIDVADSGPGIPAEMRATVFEPYRARGPAKEPFCGTGLGLAITRELAALHDGTLAVADAPEGGALFMIDLPRRTHGTTAAVSEAARAPPLDAEEVASFVEEIRPRPVAPAPPLTAPGRGTVLIVEDNAEMNATLCEALGGDYRVETAFDGKEGLAKALAHPPDLVLTDVMLPGMGGEELVTALRARAETAHVPVIVLTALTDEDVHLRLLRAGAQDYLTKPFRPAELRARVEGAVARRRAERQVEALSTRVQAVSGASVVVSEAVANLSGESIDAVLHAIAVQAQELTGAEYAVLGLGTDPDKPFDRWVFVGMPKEQATAIGRFPRAVGALGAVAGGGKVLRLRDLTQHPDYRGFPPSYPRMSSFMGVPIRYCDRIVGQLYLTNKRGGDEFTDEDQALVEMLAARAGIALETASRYEAERRERAWLEAVVEQMPDAAVVFDASGAVSLLNRAAEALRCPDDGRRDPFGNCADLDLRAPSGDPLPPDRFPHVRALSRGERVIGEDALVRRPDGVLLPVLASAVALRGPDGELLGAIASYRDMSAQRELERLRAEWSAVIAHDLRQPVGVIAFAVEMARKVHEAPMTDVEAKQLDRIDSSVRRLSSMIDELLDATRIEAHQLAISPGAVDVAALAREVCDRTANVTAGHPVSVVEAGPVRCAWADPTRVEQVLANLLSNAAKYGAPGTEIRIDVAGHGGELEVTVTNHGRGIAPEELPHLFQRFMRSHASRAAGVSGIGLGLYICKGLVEAQGGAMWAESTPGETTRFHFTLPAAPELARCA